MGLRSNWVSFDNAEVDEWNDSQISQSNIDTLQLYAANYSMRVNDFFEMVMDLFMHYETIVRHKENDCEDSLCVVCFKEGTDS